MTIAAGGEPRRRGLFITFEGGEGAGKTTQIRRLAAHLDARGLAPVVTREPGGTAGAEAIRALLVDGGPERWDAMAELLLVAAARSDHVSRLIAPALSEGRPVLCDRFLDSTRVYQGLAGGLDPAVIERLHRDVMAVPEPDLTFLLDIDPHEGLERRTAAGRGNRFEARPPEFHRRVREGFLELAAVARERFRVIDGSAAADVVAAEIAREADALLAGHAGAAS